MDKLKQEIGGNYRQIKLGIASGANTIFRQFPFGVQFPNG